MSTPLLVILGFHLHVHIGPQKRSSNTKLFSVVCSVDFCPPVSCVLLVGEALFSFHLNSNYEEIGSALAVHWTVWCDF